MFKITKHISLYNNISISDKTILNHIGKNAYCILYLKDKNLYDNLIDCDNIINNNYQLELDITDTNLSSLEIKTQIIYKILDSSKLLDKNINLNSTIENLVGEYHQEETKDEYMYDIYIFIIICIIFIGGIIYVLYILGFINFIFRKSCTSDACVKNFSIN